MVLISLHVENFGKLTDYTLKAEPGLNVILRENGWGKSTLAAFIRVMFYGFAGETKRRDAENERRRYRPWKQTGVYGGQLVFERKGKRYRIERTFGQKDREDTFRLYDEETNLPSSDYSERIGEELFQIDAAAFSRTAFTGQQDIRTGANSSIHAKIGDLSRFDDDMNRYEEVQESFKREMDALTPSRKTGAISRLKDRLAGLRALAGGKAAAEKTAEKLTMAVAEKKELRRLAEQKLRETAKQMEEAAGARDLEGLLEKYDLLVKNEEEEEGRLMKARAYFPGDVPDMARLEMEYAEARRIFGAVQTAQSLALSPEETERMNALIRMFNTGVPSDEKMEEVSRNIVEMTRMRQWEAANRLTEEEEARRRREAALFAEGIPEDKLLDSLVDDWNERERLAGAEASERAAAEEMRVMQGREFDRQREMQRAAAGRRRLILSLLGIVILCAGIVLERFGYRIYGFGLGIFGGLLLAGGLLAGALHAKGGQNDAEEEREAFMEGGRAGEMAREIEEKQARILEIDREMESFFAPYGMGFVPAEVDDNLYEIRRSAEDFRRLSVQYDTWKDRNYGEICLRMEEELDTFFRYYYETPEGTWTELLQNLRTDAAEYAALSARLSEARRARERVRGMQRNLGEFILSLGLPVTGDAAAQMTEIRDQAKEILLHEKNLEERRQQRTDFEGSCDIAAIREQAAAAGSSSWAELNRRREELTAERDGLDRDIADLRRQLDLTREQLDDLGEKEELGESISRDIDRSMRRYDLLGDTRKYLEKAMRQFSTRYMDPVRKAFGRYYMLLTGQDDSDFRMDSKLNVTRMEDGALRDTELLSAGYRDLVGICTRMAMVDAMYREEKPFLIMDDPFVNLDDEKQARGLKFLSRVAEDYQILYFTCHQTAMENIKN
ncbi:MAG: AAA family ATPase [Clostridium sp.]|nr:AAA family ATPase [Clostridium sp.]